MALHYRSTGVLAALVGALALIGLGIEIAGGLPSQLAHLYYIPVVLGALLLPVRLGLVVALLAGVAVSPVPDLVRTPLGLDPYYNDIAPWNLDTHGWIVRPLAFIAVSLLASAIVRERNAKSTAQQTSALRGEELGVLSRIDKMILAGESEEASLQEIARFALELTDAKIAGVVMPADDHVGGQNCYAYVRDGEGVSPLIERLPHGEGVSGWALLHGVTATSQDVLQDPRYDELKEHARRVGYASSVAAPIILNGEVLGALILCFEESRDLSGEELDRLHRCADQTAVAVANARQRRDLERLPQDTALVLADAIESRDPYTGEHCSRLVTYASLLGEEMGLNSKQIDAVRLGAALHDVGKIVVPDHVLKKPELLTPDEFAVMKQHCYAGGQICKKVPFMEDAYPVVYHHHEWFNGQGYPDRIAGDRIPLAARIVSVADAYDAMTSDRPYRQAMSIEDARKILRDGAGTQWDPAIVEAFLGLDFGPRDYRRWTRDAA